MFAGYSTVLLVKDVQQRYLQGGVSDSGDGKRKSETRAKDGAYWLERIRLLSPLTICACNFFKTWPSRTNPSIRVSVKYSV